MGIQKNVIEGDAIRDGEGNREDGVLENDKISVKLDNDEFNDIGEFDDNDDVDLENIKTIVDNDAGNGFEVCGDASSESENASDEDKVGSGDDFVSKHEEGEVKTILPSSLFNSPPPSLSGPPRFPRCLTSPCRLIAFRYHLPTLPSPIAAA
ncbi:hypothetical protein Salat_0514800 [Sesamum alatum]|uniref:Uncharacterized protein n=1 Tax=Sesamum alatum TaxID=300844 RepID=A0AAE2D1J2_9LAMI|nr:hypothetical protein Salat_0514800 [Sesamum alatum]